MANRPYYIAARFPDTTNGKNMGSGTIVLLNHDLFFGIKIRNALQALDYHVRAVSDTGTFVKLMQAADVRPSLGIIDINCGVDWQAIEVMTSERGDGVPLLAFGPHKDVDGLRAAKRAGVTRIVSNGEFHQNMVALVERYARSPG
jgi:hypothetical protein